MRRADNFVNLISVFGGNVLMWLVCPTPSLICLPYYLRILTLFVLFLGDWLGYEMASLAFGDNLFSMRLYVASSFPGSMWFMPFFSTYGVSFMPLGVGYRATRVFDSGWVEYFGGQGLSTDSASWSPKGLTRPVYRDFCTFISLREFQSLDSFTVPEDASHYFTRSILPLEFVPPLPSSVPI